MITAITESTPGIMCEGGVSRGTVTVRLMNSRGGQAEYKKSFFGMGVEGTVVTGTDMLFVGESDSSCHPLSNPKKVIDTVLLQLERAKNQAKAPTRKMPVIFTPDGVASALIMPLISAFNGKTVLEGASPLGKKLGEKAFDADFSLYDDPTIAYRPGSRPCDDEGVPSRRTPLMENGVVKASFMTSRPPPWPAQRAPAAATAAAAVCPPLPPAPSSLPPAKPPLMIWSRTSKKGWLSNN